MFAIQWYDPYDTTPSGKARKDGKPSGNYPTKEAADKAAEEITNRHGAFEITWKIVKIK